MKEAPESAKRHASLGWLYALMVRKNDAIAEGQRAVALKPESKGAIDGSLLSGYLAMIYARVEQNDVASVDRTSSQAFGPLDSANYSVTTNDT